MNTMSTKSAKAKPGVAKALPRDTVHQVQRPCAPEAEGKWCVSSYFRQAWKGGSIGVSFWLFYTEEEARDAADEKNARR